MTHHKLLRPEPQSLQRSWNLQPLDDPVLLRLHSPLQCLSQFLQTQSVVSMVMIYGFTSLLHVLVCWVLVFRLGMESRGAAVANGVLNWVNVILLGVYVTIVS
ncbi:hypothetical protein RHSIM_Rhsim11G0088400 [Rhododendron simsii]|uniref:Uncharacterized protein n=1 Tax=Rhododendron simsii TaxID=118357 RepID=A0A834L839_RHOSS|nr:hypothetical protein RHSIM_Rhsim11G0088400 [Rhododendron simsii]